MDDKLCETHRTNLKEYIQRQETRINNHSDRLDKLEQYRSSIEEKINNLTDKISSLVKVLWWFIGALGGAFIGFFFYAAQHGLIKWGDIYVRYKKGGKIY